MKKILPYFSTMVVYLTQVVAICNVFMLFSSTEVNGYSSIELWPWMLLSLGTFLFLHHFLSNERTLVQLAVAVFCCYLMSAGIMGTWFIHVGGVGGWFFSLGLLAVTTIQACRLNLDGCEMGTAVLCCELFAAFSLPLLWMAGDGIFYLPTYYAVCTIFMLAINVLSIAMARMETDHGRQKKSGAAMGTTVFCLGGIGTLTAIFTLALHSVLTQSSLALAHLGNGIFAIILTIFEWIFPPLSLDGAEEMYVPSEGDIREIADVYSDTEGDLRLLIAALCVAVLLAMGMALWTLIKSRKLRLTGKKFGGQYQRPNVQHKKKSLLARIICALQRAYGQIHFQLTVFSKRNTPQGAVVVLSRIGRKRGVGRRPGESYHSYLMRLAECCQGADADVAQLLAQLSDILDGVLYGGEMPAADLTLQHYRAMRRAVGRIG